MTSDEFLESGKELPNIAVMLGLLYLTSKRISRTSQCSTNNGNHFYVKSFLGKKGEKEKENVFCRYRTPCCGPTNWINLFLNSSTAISGTFY